MKRWISLLILLLMTGCATTGGLGKSSVVSMTPEMEESFQGAEKLLYAKQFPQAEQRYQDYLKTFPYNPLTPKATFRLGEIRFQNKDYKVAIAYYKKSVARIFDPEWGQRALYKEAVSWSRLNEPKKIFQVLDQLEPDQTDPKIGIRAASLRVTTSRRLEDALGAREEKKGYLELIDAYDRAGPEEARLGDLNWIIGYKTALEAIQKWASSDPSNMEENFGDQVDVLQDWLPRFEGKNSGAYLTFRLARLFEQKGDYQKAAEFSHRYLQRYPKHEYASLARSMLLEIDKRGIVTNPEGSVASAPESGRPSVGVLLPLSGKYAVYGESVLHGIECAAGVFTPCHGDLGVNLVVRDTQGDPQVAAKMVAELSQNPDIRAVIGPMVQSEVEEAAKASEAAMLPMIALSQKADLPEVGSYIFRNFLTVADQVGTIVNHACEVLKLKRFAILYPEGSVGEEYRKAFEEEVGRCGGKIVGTASYPPHIRDFTDILRQISENSFQALFVPDVYRKIPLVASGLNFLEVTGVRLLGGAGWNNPGLVKGGGDLLEGAVFVDGFFKGSHFRTQDFVSTFNNAYNMEPTLLEAYAFDSMRLLGEILKDPSATSRNNVQLLLANKKNFPGVTGDISFDEEGDARRRLMVLTVERGEIKEVP